MIKRISMFNANFYEYEYFSNDKCKKIFINKSCINNKNFLWNLASGLKIILIPTEPTQNYNEIIFHKGEIYAPYKYLQRYKEDGYTMINPANLSYMYNCVIYPTEEEIQEYKKKKEKILSYSNEDIERMILQYSQEDVTPNEGFHFIDDVNEGDLIKTIPPEPTREGYIFDGWFTEPECNNRLENK